MPSLLATHMVAKYAFHGLVDLKALTTNCDLPNWRARGLTVVKGEPLLNVSAGMGTGPFSRIRVASPPEVSLITLTAAF